MRRFAALAGFALAALAIVSYQSLFRPASPILADDDHGDFRSLATVLPIGAGPLNGEIDSTTILFDVDYFSFEALRGVRYTFNLDLLTVEDANISVINANNRSAGNSPGQVITTGINQKRVDWIARTTDTYYIEISGTQNPLIGGAYLGSYLLSSTADLSLQDRHSETQGAASLIEEDNLYQGAISPWTNQPGLTGSRDGGDDYDYFIFQAIRGVVYTVEVELGNTGGIDVSIFQPDGVLVVSSNGLGNSLEWTSPATSAYYIALSGSSQFQDSIGAYSLQLKGDATYTDRHGQDHQSASKLSFGNAHQGAVSPEDDLDVFSFQTERGIRYSIETQLVTTQGIELTMEDGSGALVATNGGVGTSLDWIAPTADIYYLVVAGSSQVRSVVGTYSLTVVTEPALMDRHADAKEGATNLSFGNALQGSISPANDRDYFSFEAQRGILYSVEVGLGSADGAEIVLSDDGGNIQASYGGIGATLNWRADRNATYFIAVAAPLQASDPVGTYTLKVEANTALIDRHGDDSVSSTLVSIGSTYLAAISPKDDRDFFTFRATRGVRYSFQLTYGTAAAVSLTVSNADIGTVAARNFGDGTNVIWVAPDNEWYVVEITGSLRVQDPNGTYSLQIQSETNLEDRHGDSDAEATPLVLGNAVAGAVSPPDDSDYFYFNAEQRQKYVVLLELGTAEALRVSVKQVLAGFATSNFGNATRLEWEAPITGRHVLVVTAADQVQGPVGTYHLTLLTLEEELSATPTPTSIPVTPAPADKPTGPALYVESRVAESGGTVLVPVVLQGAQGLTSLGFTISYNPLVVELTGVRKGAGLTPANFSYNDDVPGAVRIGFASAAGLRGIGSAAVLEFRLVGGEDDKSSITLSEVLASGGNGDRLLLGLADGVLTVGQPDAGDGNGDGQVTALDALIALRMAAQQIPESLVLDVDGDGSVTSLDAQQILAMARPG